MLTMHMSADDLCTVLANSSPAQLKGLALLKGQRLLPQDIPRQTLREAVLELIQYTDQCAKMTRRLVDVPPMPLAFPELGWAL